MSLSKCNQSMIIYSLRMIIFLIMGSMISPAEAAVSCTSTSYQCCWVIRSWQLMGKTTSVSSTSATACCYYLRSTTITTQTTGIPGVSCWSTGIVFKIYWYKQDLSGSIPSDVGNLKNLEKLIIFSNQGLSGEIPSTIGNLVSLTYLSLGENKLNGSIPTTIGKLTKLTVLQLSSNQLTGPILSEIGNLVNLRDLSLERNRLNGPIPSTIGKLTNLEWLVLYINQLTGIPPEIGNLKNLQYLELSENQLTGSIPSTIGNLVNLQKLNLDKNFLSGTIPSTIGNLVNLQGLSVYGNVGLTGAFTPNCGTSVFALKTKITICGCATKGSPAVLFPPPGTPDACLATGPSSPLQKRVEIFSQNIGSFKYTCNVDVNLNPFQDCLNTQAKICNTTDMGTDPTRLSDCKNGVNQMAQGMSTWWQAVRKECGQWPWIDGFRGSKDSSNCAVANNNLIANAYYVTTIGRVYVTSALTNSVNVGLWSNTKLKG